MNRREIMTGTAALGVSSAFPLPALSIPAENRYLLSYLNLASVYEPEGCVT